MHEKEPNNDFKHEMQTMVSEIPKRIEETLQSSPEDTWLSALRNKLTLINGTTDFAVMDGKLSQDEGTLYLAKIKELVTELTELHKTTGGNPSEEERADILEKISVIFT